MTARKPNPLPRVCIVLNAEKSRLTAAAASVPSSYAEATPGTASINVLQARMLDALLAAGDRALGRVELISAADSNHSTIARPFADLRERGLVAVEQPGGERRPQYITLTPKGRKALHAYRQAQANAIRGSHSTPPRTYICTEPYVVPTATYTRNTGHPHIASHGVRC